jgi:hypothetical protein
MGQYVGIDLHRRNTTIYRMAEDGKVLGIERILSQPFGDGLDGRVLAWTGRNGAAGRHSGGHRKLLTWRVKANGERPLSPGR